MLRLSGRVQYYPWGSVSAIPEFLGFSPDGRAYAEIWFGAHPSAPSLAIPATSLVPATGYDRWSGKEPLDQTIALAPQEWLGAEIAGKFDGKLPYLVKLLAADRPLSLQAHPSIEQARTAYDQEREIGTPANERNYQDRNHKPEALIALTNILAYAGFRQPTEIAEDLQSLASGLLQEDQNSVSRLAAQELGEIIDMLTQEQEAEPHRIEAGFVGALNMSAEPLAATLNMLSQREAVTLDRCPEDLQALDVARYVLDFYPGDNGVLAALFLNHVSLRPGEALAVGAGVVHCYVHGFGIEVMANSDNVLRAGLTSKKIDIPELVRILDFTPGDAQVIHGRTGVVTEYSFPFQEFAVTIFEPELSAAAWAVPSAGPRLVLGIDASVVVDGNEGHCALARGEALFVADSEVVTIAGSGRAAVISVPDEH